MQKAIVSLIVAIVAVSPLIAGMMGSAKLGGDYINEHSYRYFSPEVRQEKYDYAVETVSLINGIAKPLLAFMAFFVFVMTAAEYWKFYKMYREEMGKG